MTAPEVVSLIAPFLGLLAPLLVYLAARQKMGREAHRDTAEDENTLWERMTVMMDRYGRRADELEAKFRQAEADRAQLTNEVAELRGSMARWKNYAMALVRQIQGANLVPLNPTDFGLGDED